jgi:hypothetical protein
MTTSHEHLGGEGLEHGATATATNPASHTEDEDGRESSVEPAPRLEPIEASTTPATPEESAESRTPAEFDPTPSHASLAAPTAPPPLAPRRARIERAIRRVAGEDAALLQPAVALALGIIVAVLWTCLPGGLPFMRPPLLDAAEVDAGARRALVLTSQRIDRFYRDRQRLPTDLSELNAGSTDPVAYQILGDDRYRVSAPGTHGMLSLLSDEPRDAFLAQDGSGR